MKKIVFMLVFALTLALIVPAAASETEGGYDRSLAGTVINVYNWGQYISDGSDGTLDVNAEFTRRTGIIVNYSTYDSNETLYTKLKTGGASYDVIIPSDYMVAKLIEENLLLPLNFDNIPNYRYIDEEFKNKSFDPGNAYSVPYTWGCTGVIYNTKYVTDPVTGWDALWNEKYSGKILMFENSRDAFAVGALLLGLDVNSTDPADLDAIAEKLSEQRPLVQAYVMDQCYEQMINEEAWLVSYYAGDFLQMQAENPSLAFCLPKEGFNLFIDSMCIPVSCANKAAAEAYINFLCDPEICGRNLEAIGYSAPNSAAKAYMSEETAQNAVAYPDSETLSRGVSFENLPNDTIRYVNDLWLKVRTGGRSTSWVIYAAAAAAVAGVGIFFAIRRKKRNNY